MRALITAVILSLVPVAAHASCAQREDIIAKLQDSYDEVLRFGGLQKTRGAPSVMEVWVSSETGSFTVISTQANGFSCIVAVGTDFFEAIPKAGDPT
jgi:hypothetical protein